MATDINIRSEADAEADADKRVISEDAADVDTIGSVTATLVQFIKQYDSAIVAFSGGLDSSLVLWATVAALGADKTLAVTSASAALPSADREELAGILSQVGLDNSRHRFVYTKEMEIAGYYENSPQRCYYCKSELYGDLAELREREQIAVVFDGCNQSDLLDYRPGQRAGKEKQVVSPLLACGIDKATARAIVRAQSLTFAEKPASACLSSRIPHGVRITDEVLAQVDRAELALKRLGFSGHRVRYHNEIARVELQDADIERIALAETRAAVVEAIKSAGFRFVTVDLEGYRLGSLNPDSVKKKEV